MACTDASLLKSNQQRHSGSSYLEHLTEEEAHQIREQFRGLPFKPGCQVMWSGVPREWAQHWADENEMQTLTTAMGPLMMKENPSCVKQRKSKKQWLRYVQGASALFADHVPKGHVVTVLSRPPPQKLHPQGLSTYQTIEEPVLKGIFGGATVSRIEMVHPTVIGAETYRYQDWPIDETNQWIGKYGLNPLRKNMREGTKRVKEVKTAIGHKSPCSQKESLHGVSHGKPAGKLLNIQTSTESLTEDRDKAIDSQSDARNLTRAEGSDVSTDRDNAKTMGGLEKTHKAAIQKTIKEVNMELSKGVTKNEIIKKKAVKKKKKRKRKGKTATQ